MNGVKLTGIDTQSFNPFGATAEELVAIAINESGLMGDGTEINGIPAKTYCDSFYEKRLSYEESNRLGRLLIKNLIITQNQLDEALGIQRQNRKLKLGQILINMNMCSKGDVTDSLSMQTTLRTYLE